LGEVPVIFVQRKGEASEGARVSAAGRDDEGAQIQASVLAGLGRIYVPRDVLWVERLPENAVGKVDRKALAQQVKAAASA
jgi:acyl-coenzyme A synthetase/AMP-(fatty) acid ligase